MSHLTFTRVDGSREVLGVENAGEAARIRNSERRGAGLPHYDHSGRYISSEEISMLDRCGE